MWRYLVGAVAALMLAGAGVLLFKGGASEPPLPAAPRTGGGLATADVAADEAALPEASPASREQRRFNRFDKDRDGRITRDEYLLARRKAFAKLDTNGDGRLGFEEWAVKTTGKFVAADRDKSGAMDAREFATTAVKRKPRAAPRCVCPAPAAEAED